MKDKSLSQSGEVLITEYINVSEKCTIKANWSKKWGELIEDTLYLYPTNDPNTQAEYKFVVKELEIQPAVKETNRMLAFKLVANNRLIIVLEPLNINDMGRWISSLFAAIQGLSSSSIFKADQIKASKEIKPSQKYALDEKPSFLINVRSLAAKFEKLAEAEEKTKELVKRSKSTPNLADTDQSDTVDSLIIFSTENSSINGPVPRTETKIVKTVELRKKRYSGDQREAPQQTSISRVKSWRGPYMSQDEERAILNQLTNPYLAKRNLVKQEQKIQRLEVTVKAIIERVERQKKTFNETKFSLREFKSQATEDQDQKEIESLEQQCSTLQEQIDQSEQSIKEYKEEIHKLEEEMIEISKHINWEDKKVANAVPATQPRRISLGANATLTTTVQTKSSDDVKPSAASKENGRDTENSPDNSSGEEEINMNAPAWVREAQRKSKNAYKILSRQGILK